MKPNEVVTSRSGLLTPSLLLILLPLSPSEKEEWKRKHREAVGWRISSTSSSTLFSSFRGQKEAVEVSELGEVGTPCQSSACGGFFH